VTYGNQLFFQATSGDLNGDGLLDLVTTLYPRGGFDVFFGQTDGGLSAPAYYPNSDGRTIDLGDVNGDGLLDVVTSDGQQVAILVNNGEGALTPWASLPVSAVHTGLGIGDFNADGRADVVISEFANTAGGALFDAKLFLNEGNGTFAPAIPLPGVGGTAFQGLAVGDLNGDGLADIAANTPDGGALVVLLNHGDGGFGATYYPTAPSEDGALLLVPRAGSAPDLVLGLASGGDGGLAVMRN